MQRVVQQALSFTGAGAAASAALQQHSIHTSYPHFVQGFEAHQGGLEPRLAALRQRNAVLEKGFATEKAAREAAQMQVGRYVDGAGGARGGMQRRM